jgi:hypothetical protein
VVLVAGDEEVLVGGDVDQAQAEAREVGRERLGRDDPDLPRPGEEEVLDPAVRREDAEAADEAVVEMALRPVDLEDAAGEVGLEALHELERAGIAATAEARDRTAAVDAVLRIGEGPTARSRELGEGHDAGRRGLAQDLGQDLRVGAGLLRSARARLERRLDLEREIGRRLDRLDQQVVARADLADVALADPDRSVRVVGDVGGGPPDEREVLVEDACEGLEPATPLARLHDPDHAEAELGILTNDGDEEAGSEELEVVARRVALLEDPGRMLARRTGDPELHAGGDERPEFPGDPCGRPVVEASTRHDAIRRSDRGQFGPPPRPDHSASPAGAPVFCASGASPSAKIGLDQATPPSVWTMRT